MTISINYSGFSENILSKEQLSSLFDKLWGESARQLPTFPKVIGGVNVLWRNADGNEHNVNSLNEMLDAYQNKLTYDIHIKGGISNAPKCYLVYTPSSKHVKFKVTASSQEIANEYVKHVKEMFPKNEIPTIFISYAGEELALAEFIKKILDRWTGDKIESFVAKRNIPPGGDPLKIMEMKLKSAVSIIPICSIQAKDSNWVWWETAAIWGRGYKVYPLFTNTTAKDFGAPLNLFTQGRKYFDKIEFADTLKTVCKQLHVDIDSKDFSSEELDEYKKLVEEYSKEKRSAKINVDYEKVDIKSELHEYSLIFDVENRTKEAFKDIAVELYFPIEYLKRKGWDYPHLKSSTVRDKPGYLCLTFMFSGLKEDDKRQFSSYLLPGKTLRVFGAKGINFLLYEMDDDRWENRFKFEVLWKVYINGGAPQEESKPLNLLQCF